MIENKPKTLSLAKLLCYRISQCKPRLYGDIQMILMWSGGNTMNSGKPAQTSYVDEILSRLLGSLGSQEVN